MGQGTSQPETPDAAVDAMPAADAPTPAGTTTSESVIRNARKARVRVMIPIQPKLMFAGA
jgi:hypothetical protein